MPCALFKTISGCGAFKSVIKFVIRKRTYPYCFYTLNEIYESFIHSLKNPDSTIDHSIVFPFFSLWGENPAVLGTTGQIRGQGKQVCLLFCLCVYPNKFFLWEFFARVPQTAQCRPNCCCMGTFWCAVGLVIYDLHISHQSNSRHRSVWRQNGVILCLRSYLMYDRTGNFSPLE